MVDVGASVSGGGVGKNFSGGRVDGSDCGGGANGAGGRTGSGDGSGVFSSAISRMQDLAATPSRSPIASPGASSSSNAQAVALFNIRKAVQRLRTKRLENNVAVSSSSSSSSRNAEGGGSGPAGQNRAAPEPQQEESSDGHAEEQPTRGRRGKHQASVKPAGTQRAAMKGKPVARHMNRRGRVGERGWGRTEAET